MPSVSTSYSRIKPHRLRGYVYIGTAALLWGIAATLGRAAFTGRLLSSGALPPIDPLILSQSRTTFSLIVLFPVLASLRGWRKLRMPVGDIAQTFLLGVLGVAASNYFYYLAIQKTNVATAIVIQYTAPVWVLLYIVARGLQKATAAGVAAVLLAVTGCAMVIGVIGPGTLRLNSLGLVAATVAAFAFAFYNIAGHSILARYDRWIVLMWTLLAASIFWIFVNPPWKISAAHYSGLQWMFLFVFSLVSVLGPFSLYFAGLQHLEPTRAIVVSCLEPVFSIVIAAAVLGEVMRPVQTLGIVAVLSAIVLVQLPDRKSHQGVVVEPIE
jgi:drug/metabolite transporter (DMT)-like permease